MEEPEDMDNEKRPFTLFGRLRRRASEQTASDQEKRDQEKEKDNKESLELKPAMPELGTTPCPVCKRRVAVFVTRTKRPFINCGYCSARIFYNGSRSMALLKDQIKPTKKGWLK